MRIPAVVCFFFFFFFSILTRERELCYICLLCLVFLFFIFFLCELSHRSEPNRVAEVVESEVAKSNAAHSLTICNGFIMAWIP